jgi:hypothetical protein
MALVVRLMGLYRLTYVERLSPGFFYLRRNVKAAIKEEVRKILTKKLIGLSGCSR